MRTWTPVERVSINTVANCITAVCAVLIAIKVL
jgi:hypothetical protein